MIMKRILIVDMHIDYSNEEIKCIQSILDKKTKGIFVYREILKTGEVILCAIADILFSYTKVCNMVGSAYIEGVSGEHSL